MKILFLFMAIIYGLTIIIIKKLLNDINKELIEETNKNTEYQIEFEKLLKLVKELSGTQGYGNKDICLRKIENQLNKIKEKMEETWK